MNVIFDLGGVTLAWSTELFLNYNSLNEKEKLSAHENILKTNLWVHLDKGTMTTQELIDAFSSNSEIDKMKIEKMLHSIPDVLEPINETVEIIRTLKAKGNKLFVLSNMAFDASYELERKYNFWELFDGIVFSSRVKMVKPNSDIFHYILDKYDLDVSDTVFIDDTKENILAANKLGFKTIHFQSPGQCETELNKLNCF